MKYKESGQLNIEVTHTLVIISMEVPPKLDECICSNCINVELKTGGQMATMKSYPFHFTLY